MTHLHPDHASAISDFPEATFLVTKAEWEAASDGGQRDGYVKRQFDHGFDYRLSTSTPRTRTRSPASPARSTSSATAACASRSRRGTRPGTCRWCSRPQHGEVLLAGDAIFMRRTLDEEHLPHLLDDEHLFRRSLREIKQYVKETPDALVFPGHDWEAWEKLEPVY